MSTQWRKNKADHRGDTLVFFDGPAASLESRASPEKAADERWGGGGGGGGENPTKHFLLNFPDTE